MRFADFDVKIVIERDGWPVPAPEYKIVLASDGLSASAYVEALIGVDYWIECSYTGTAKLTEEYARLILYFVDGRQMGQRAITDSRHGSFPKRCEVVEHHGDRVTRTPFKFCTPAFSNQGEDSEDVLSSVGRIDVELYEGRFLHEFMGLNYERQTLLGEVRNDTKLGSFLSAATSVGSTKFATEASTNESCVCEKGPLLFTFKFMYRTRDVLQFEGIIPRIKEAASSGQSSAPSEQPDALAPPINEINIKLEGVKSEVVEVEPDSQVAPERNEQPRARVTTKRARTVKSTVVDLTVSDDEDNVPVQFVERACTEMRKMRSVLGGLYYPALDLISQDSTARLFLAIDDEDREGWVRWKLKDLKTVSA
ncbi:hypothetical protein AC1031_019572 [Aphanomyces cochlioides]|nr:hypothetical protein AC1031_019572 [Aphanomyces cochlioides]